MAASTHASILFVILFAAAAAARPLADADAKPPAQAQQPTAAAQELRLALQHALDALQAHQNQQQHAADAADDAAQPRRMLYRVGASTLSMLAANNAKASIQMAVDDGSPAATMYATRASAMDARLATGGIGSYGYYGLTAGRAGWW